MNEMKNWDRYADLYYRVYKNKPNYGSHHGKEAVPFVASLLQGGGTLLDVGCGRFQFLKDIQCNAPSAIFYGTDVVQATTVPEGIIFIKSPSWDLSSVPESIDILTSFDVLEHLYEEDVEPTFLEWEHRVHKYVILSIAYKKAINTQDGENLHKCIYPEKWWIERLSKHFPCVSINNQGYIICRMAARSNLNEVA